MIRGEFAKVSKYDMIIDINYTKMEDKISNLWERIKNAKITRKISDFCIKNFGKVSPLRQRIKKFLRVWFGKTTHDAMLEKAYVGKNYDKFVKHKFNVPAFFLSSLYMFYRRMYVTAVLTFAANIALIVITHNLIPYSAPNLAVDIFHQIMIGIVIGFLINKYYLWVVARKVMRIKAKYPGKARLELKGICEVLGGAKLRASGIGMLLEIVVMIAMILVFAVQFVVEEISGSAIRIENTMEEAANEVQDVMHNDLAPAVDEIVEHIFGNGKLHETTEEYKGDDF